MSAGTPLPTASPTTQSGRLVGLDALRGIAAILVMLFHYTTQYQKFYSHTSLPALSVSWGHYGVNLFFMISGFVIFLTLHRIQRPLDFIVSRFSRLFPTYWAAVILTFGLTYALDLPNKTVNIGTAALNLFMIHGLFRIPHVDSVYWTLEIEMIFYTWALLLYVLGRLNKIHAILFGFLALQLLYFLIAKFAGIDLSYFISHIFILDYIAWFACGIMTYRLVMLPDESPKMDCIIIFLAAALLSIVNSPYVGTLALSLTAILWLTASGRLPFLSNPILAWLGTISYPLYLLHENIGWGIIRQAEMVGIDPNLSIVIAIGIVLTMATAVTQLVERPAMKWIRGRYHKRNHLVPLAAG